MKSFIFLFVFVLGCSQTDNNNPSRVTFTGTWVNTPDDTTYQRDSVPCTATVTFNNNDPLSALISYSSQISLTVDNFVRDITQHISGLRTYNCVADKDIIRYRSDGTADFSNNGDTLFVYIHIMSYPFHSISVTLIRK